MKYYLVGIKGAGLSALAIILHDLGYEVAGYDDEVKHQFTEDKLHELNIPIYNGENDAMDENTIIVRSSAIALEHKEIIKANSLNLKIYEYNEMLGKLTNMFDSITVAGCHGKTTTTSMLAHVFDNIIGANYLIGDGSGHADKKNRWFILEACEYRRNFLAYEPDYAIITNIELDHVDYYRDIDDVIDAYNEYANKALKMVIACGDDQYTRSLNINPSIFYYGINEDNDIVAKNIEYANNGTSFDVFVEDNYYGHFEIKTCGRHMLLNSLAVIGVCYYERMEAKDVSKILKTFTGAKRRFEEVKIKDNVIVDDYAHHPTEVSATIESAKQKYPDKKVVAIFQPHTFTRTDRFKDELVIALNKADSAYLLDIYPSREKQEDYPSVTSNIIVDKLKNGYMINNEMVDELLKYDNTVFLFMSPKEIYDLKKELIDNLNNK